MGLLTVVVVHGRVQATWSIPHRVQEAEIPTAAFVWHAQTAEVGWLAALLVALWCLGAALAHGVVRPDRRRAGIACVVALLALVSGDGRLWVSTIVLAVSSLAPGGLGLSACLAAVVSGWLGHESWLAYKAIEGDPSALWLAWGTRVVWPAAGLAITFRLRRMIAAWSCLLGGIGLWTVLHLDPFGERTAAVAPWDLTEMFARAAIVAPVHRPIGKPRIGPFFVCVFALRSGEWVRLEGTERACGSSPSRRRDLALVDADTRLSDLALGEPGEFSFAVQLYDGVTPPGFAAWRWSWATLWLLRDGTRFAPRQDAVRVTWVDGTPMLVEQVGQTLTEANLRAVLMDGSSHVDLVVQPGEDVTLQQWLEWCELAQVGGRSVRCAIAARSDE